MDSKEDEWSRRCWMESKVMDGFEGRCWPMDSNVSPSYGFEHEGFERDGFEYDGFEHDGFEYDGFETDGFEPSNVPS